jgi:predicted Zn-dependent peptidase
MPDNDTELLTVVMMVLAGEVDFDGPEGLSHYLEHLMFWHADNVKGESIHSRDGNAWVNGLVTSYYNRGELSDLPDMIEFARRLLTPPELHPRFMREERDVVTREYDLRVSENPDYRVLTDLRKQLYDNHPVSRSVIGTPKSIGSLTIKHALDFHKQYYLPANAILIVKGNADEKQISELINSRFSSLPSSKPSPSNPHAQTWRTASIEGQLNHVGEFAEKQAKSSRLVYTSLSTWSNEKDDDTQGLYSVQFVRQLLESALPGSLAKPLRLDNFIISQYELDIFKLLDKQVELNILAWPDDGISLDNATQSLADALTQLGEDGVPKKSFERIKKRWLQTAQRRGGDADELLWRTWFHLMLGLQPNSQADHIQRIESITLTDINSLLASLGKPQRKVVGLIKGQ